MNTTVMPFILRAIKLVGVEVTTCPIPLREVAWARLSRELPAGLLDQIFKIIALEEVPQFAKDLLSGRVNGRVVVDVSL